MLCAPLAAKAEVNPEYPDGNPVAKDLRLSPLPEEEVTRRRTAPREELKVEKWYKQGGSTASGDSVRTRMACNRHGDAQIFTDSCDTDILGLNERDIDTDEDSQHGKLRSPVCPVGRGGDDSDATDDGSSPTRHLHKLASKSERYARRSQLQRHKLTRDIPVTWTAPPRVLCVTRRHLRKGKYVDFLGEYHLDLIQENGGAAIMLPRTALTAPALAEYLPMDGLLVVEGNDISDEILSRYGCCIPRRLDGEDAMKWASDTEFDVSKDELEFALMRLALDAGCPILSLCRGSQMLNVLRGGTLIGDIEKEVPGAVVHLKDASGPSYDSHRHPIRVLPGTPLASWFEKSLVDTDELHVNSYHHQGVQTLGKGLKPMAYAPDGVLEGFYDSRYNPSNGRFVIGLQFHPERMMGDYPGCKIVYEAKSMDQVGELISRGPEEIDGTETAGSAAITDCGDLNDNFAATCATVVPLSEEKLRDVPGHEKQRVY
ncbi:GAT1_2.1 [Symbiodinium microadriaticum]|nr:GAT1_2.1 [Symbiodinium microadriaticum]